ncbi:hypothetical protein ACVCAH_30870, partial [Micromonospora sp. LZ34]
RAAPGLACPGRAEPRWAEPRWAEPGRARGATPDNPATPPRRDSPDTSRPGDGRHPRGTTAPDRFDDAGGG